MVYIGIPKTVLQSFAGNDDKFATLIEDYPAIEVENAPEWWRSAMDVTGKYEIKDRVCGETCINRGKGCNGFCEHENEKPAQYIVPLPELKETYGKATMVDDNKHVTQQVDIINYIRATFKDHRLCSVSELEGETYIVAVENPASTGRGALSSMHLSEESLVGLMTTILFYWNCKGLNIDKLFMQAVDKEHVDYDFSHNLNPFKPIDPKPVEDMPLVENETPEQPNILQKLLLLPAKTIPRDEYDEDKTRKVIREKWVKLDSVKELVCEHDLTIDDYKAVLEDHKRMIREIDVLMNGDNAAAQASMCDIVSQLTDIFNKK